MFNNKIRFSSKYFHFEEAKFRVDVVQLVHHSLDCGVFLNLSSAFQAGQYESRPASKTI